MKYALFSLLTIVLMGSCMNDEPGTTAKRSFPKKPEQPHQLQALLAAVPVSANDSLKEAIYTDKLIQSLIDRHFTGCRLSEFVKGDLNEDGKEDLFVIASKACGESEGASDYSTCYTSMIFLAETPLRFTFAASNSSIIECSDCTHGGPTVSISDNKLFITTHLGSCVREDITEIYQYQSSDKAWYLKKKEITGFNCNDHLNTTESVETSKDFGVIKF